MQGLMIYENPVIRLGFTTIMKTEFDVDIDYTDRNVVLRAANALIPYESVEAFLIDTVYFRSENGNTEMSETPFGSEEARAQSNNVMTGSIDY